MENHTNYIDRSAGSYRFLVAVTRREAVLRSPGSWDLIPESRWTNEERNFFAEYELDKIEDAPCVRCGAPCRCYRADGATVYCGCAGGAPQDVI